MPTKMLEALNEMQIRRAKPEEGDRKLFDGRGLFLLIRSNGSKLWRLKFRFAGKERLLALGEYPDVGLVAARERAGKARVLIRDGVDPVQAGREQRIANTEAALQTFEVVAEEWLAKRGKVKKWTEGHVEQNRQSLNDYVYPKLGKRPISQIGAPEVIRILDVLERDGKLETLRRVRQRVSSVFSHAVATGRRVDNPIRDVQGAFEAPTRKHFASVGPEGLPDFLRALRGYQGHPHTVAIVRMILWTACRTGEIRKAAPDEFDLDEGLWSAPAGHMKKRRIHVMPLPRQAVELLRPLVKANADAKYLLPSPMGDYMASENIVLQAIEKLGFSGRLTGHGLRAAVATGLEELGFATELVKVQLSHAKGDQTDQAYLRGVHIERRTEMMQRWADHLDAMEQGVQVTPIRRRKAA